ncbi:Bromodomain-containing protein, partial [Clavulina sp. PMI_390]
PKSHTILSVAQHKFAMSALKSLRKQKDSYAFNVPVDPILLKIPHYFGVVKQPMDFSTIEAKLVASNPAKRIEQSMASQPRYYSILEFNADVQLVFDNCYLFNGPDHIVSQSARRLQATFEKLTKNMPPPQAPAPVFKSPTPTPQPAPQPAAAASTSQPKKQARRSSASVPTIRRVDSANANEFVSARPKREIHPPAPKDSGYEEGAPKRAGGPRVGKNGKRKKDDGTLDQLRFCGKIITDLYKKQYAAFAGFFYDPVDENIAPNYYKVIKKPMDMSTMKRNLDQKQYSDANAFYDDFQLMISNCVRYNPVGTHVYIAGQDLAKTFNDKWRQLPPLHTPEPSDEEEEEEEEGPDTSTLQHLEAQLAGLRQTIEGLKKGNKVKSSPAAKNSAKKAGGAGAGRRMLDADATLTFEEKKELSEAIQDLDGPDLEEVIKIIQQGVADIGENTDEIEIEIDALPPAVLRALWAVVIKPKQPVATAVAAKPFKSGRNQAGTGGLKRKSMDENAESEKMRLLEQRVQMFD